MPSSSMWHSSPSIVKFEITAETTYTGMTCRIYIPIETRVTSCIQRGVQFEFMTNFWHHGGCCSRVSQSDVHTMTAQMKVMLLTGGQTIYLNILWHREELLLFREVVSQWELSSARRKHKQQAVRWNDLKLGHKMPPNVAGSFSLQAARHYLPRIIAQPTSTRITPWFTCTRHGGYKASSASDHDNTETTKRFRVGRNCKARL